MEHLKVVNQAIAYIEKRLMQPLATAEVAAAMGYSRAHFGRLFLEMTGETLAGYMRKRRLSEAAYKLVTTRCPILELALDYQFESQEAFTRSFKQCFHLSPGAYRRRGRCTGLFHRITLSRPRIHRLFGEKNDIHVSDFSSAADPVRQGIVPVQLYSLLMKHSEPSLRATHANAIYFLYR